MKNSSFCDHLAEEGRWFLAVGVTPDERGAIVKAAGIKAGNWTGGEILTAFQYLSNATHIEGKDATPLRRYALGFLTRWNFV